MNENFSKSIGYKINKTTFVINKIADSTLKLKVNLTLSQFLLLMTVVENSNIKQIEIANFLEMTQAAISRQIKMLKNKKYITVNKNQENYRENFINPSPLGREIFTKSNDILHTTFDDIFKITTEKEKVNLEKILDKLLFSICVKINP